MGTPPGSSASGEPPSAPSFEQVRYERSPGSTEIHLVRHGESAATDPDRPFPLVGGRGDPELSPRGCAQADAVARRLGSLDLSGIYVTPLRRTAETATPLARALGVDPVVEPDLVEVHMGEWEGGVYRRRIAEQDPLAVRVFLEERWDIVPGAESNDALGERTGGAIARIAAAHPGGCVVAVSHAVTISAILARATSARPFAFIAVDNASISTLVVSGDRWTLRRFNDTAHLDG
ncbi:MAG TPA: histidine phosphatase family protein [Acidimicrobiales bacterium]|nr:histidine phosphatase family protein [Acidimicrobiales bacterium]